MLPWVEGLFVGFNAKQKREGVIVEEVQGEDWGQSPFF